MSNVNTVTPPQYSVDWNNVALQAITLGLDEIPVVGGILSHLFAAFWPQSGVDVWAEIKQNVQTLIGQDISKEVYTNVQDRLGSASQSSGLVGNLQDYLGSINPDPSKNNGMNPEDTWNNADGEFTNALGDFQAKGSGYELLLLPLFAQFANLHLSLLRDGVEKGWVNDSYLQGRIQQYTGWAETTYQTGYQSRQAANKGFNYLNQYVQAMQVGVMNFRETWPYFDPTKYPPPVKVTFTNQTYFSITGQLGRSSGDYTLPATPAGDVTNIDVYWLLDNCDNYNLLLGTQVNYTGAQQPYQGVPIGGAVLSPGQSCDPDVYDSCNYKQGAGVGADNPVVAVSGVYESTGGVYAVDFVYKDGTSTGQTPDQSGANQAYPLSFDIAPPGGYYLRSVWTTPQTFWYNSAVDMVFGFGYTPPELDLATARALYTSSLHPIPGGDARFEPFAEAAASEGWEGQRQQFLARLKPPARP